MRKQLGTDVQSSTSISVNMINTPNTAHMYLATDFSKDWWYSFCGTGLMLDYELYTCTEEVQLTLVCLPLAAAAAGLLVLPQFLTFRGSVRTDVS